MKKIQTQTPRTALLIEKYAKAVEITKKYNQLAHELQDAYEKELREYYPGATNEGIFGLAPTFYVDMPTAGELADHMQYYGSTIWHYDIDNVDIAEELIPF